MRGLRIRLLLIAVAAVGLTDLALTGRSRSRPTPTPRTTESGANEAPVSPSDGAAPVGFNRLIPSQREQETTIRPRTTTSQPPPQMRTVEPADREQVLAVVEQAIQRTARRYLDVDQFTPWQIMHGLLALRGDYKLKQSGKVVSGIDFVSSGPIFRGDYWWERTAAGGRGHPYSVPYHFEGHVNQFPALLSMSALPLEHKLVAKGGTITIGDIIRNAQRTVNTNEELTWTLWLLTQYVSQDATWVNQQGQNWSMAELVRLQVGSGVNEAPCGGTHQLFALAFSRNAYLKQHSQLRGVWVNAEYKLRQYTEMARQLQNPDGSFSTNYFKGRGYSADFKERIKTSGHMLEWLMMALPASRLDEPWVRRGIQSVANDLIRNASAPAECGPMYHALHGLVLYRERVAPAKSATPPDQLASAPKPQENSVAQTMPSITTPAPRSTPTDVPPEPAAPEKGAAQPKAMIRDAAPQIVANKPSQPGIAVISPAAPATVAAQPTKTPTPSVARSTPAVAPPAPAMLNNITARPIDGTAEPAADHPPLVLKQPLKQPDESATAATPKPVMTAQAPPADAAATAPTADAAPAAPSTAATAAAPPAEVTVPAPQSEATTAAPPAEMKTAAAPAETTTPAPQAETTTPAPQAETTTTVPQAETKTPVPQAEVATPAPLGPSLPPTPPVEPASDSPAVAETPAGSPASPESATTAPEESPKPEIKAAATDAPQASAEAANPVQLDAPILPELAPEPQTADASEENPVSQLTIEPADAGEVDAGEEAQAAAERTRAASKPEIKSSPAAPIHLISATEIEEEPLVTQ